MTIMVGSYTVRLDREEERLPRTGYDELFPQLLAALEAGDTATWDRLVTWHANMATATPEDLEIPGGNDLHLSLPLHERFHTLFALAHRATLALTGERI